MPVSSPVPLGLSPRLRGNLDPPSRRSQVHRSIPALAGEPTANTGSIFSDGVYPRVCGGTRMGPTSSLRSKGLSPRLRGNPQVASYAIMEYRSIPAFAGEPRWTWPPGWPLKVYPRVCGGTTHTPPATAPRTGLSPRLRGNRSILFNSFCSWRSIPAFAGEPRVPRRSSSPPGVYPRVCGGTAGSLRGPSILKGLSPRLRENRLAPGAEVP